MNSKSATASDLGFPLPVRQFQGFLLFFHALFLGALALTLITHIRQAPQWRWQETVLTALVAVQMGLYLCFLALPSLAITWPALNWFRHLMRDATDTSQRDYHVALRWWGLYIGTSVALVFAESRIDHAFEWPIIAYVGQISALPLRFSVPATLTIFCGWLLSRFGWATLWNWHADAWAHLLVPVTSITAMVFFMGRMVATSAERGRLIVELKRAKRELELAHDREMELATLRERERLARDLHDNLGHSLVTLTVQLEAAQRLAGLDAKRAGSLLTEMQKLTRSSMEDLRRSLAGLRTPGLGDRPLASAVRDICTDLAGRSGSEVTCDVRGDFATLRATVAEALWRVVQEGLTNVEKHAHAKRVEVSILIEADNAVVRVKDDGAGMPPQREAAGGHFGLRGLRERLEGLGGGLHIDTETGKGTALTGKVPLIK